MTIEQIYYPGISTFIIKRDGKMRFGARGHIGEQLFLKALSSGIQVSIGATGKEKDQVNAINNK